MSKLEDLVNILKVEAHRLNEERVNEDQLVKQAFVKSIEKTMSEIRQGLDSRDFQELVIINFMIIASEENLSPKKVQDFILYLKE